MSLLDYCFLDHFYIGVDAADFDSLKLLLQNFPGAIHRVVQSKELSWEGIYLRDRSGSYLEILKRSPQFNYQIGLALSPLLPHYLDVSKIPAQMPWLNWQEDAYFHADGQKWFRSLSPMPEDDTCPAHAWLMKYELSHWPQPLPVQPKALQYFESATFRVPAEKFGRLSEMLSWVPGAQMHGSQEAWLEIPGRGERPFKMSFVADFKTKDCSLIEIRAQSVDGHHIAPAEQGVYRLIQQGHVVLLTF